jgi:hypothetical protein
LDIFFFNVGIASTFSCSQIPFDSFFSWPPPLRSCGIFYFTSSSWTIPLLRFFYFSICISSSWVVPLGPTFVFSSYPDTSILVRLPQTKSRKLFW